MTAKTDAYLLQSLDAFDAESEKLLGFQLCSHPVLRWLQIPITLLAPQNSDLLLYWSSDVHLRPDAVDTHIGGIAHDGSTAETTQSASNNQ